jgi:hypothetical protein
MTSEEWWLRSVLSLFSLFTILRTLGEQSADDPEEREGGLGDLPTYFPMRSELEHLLMEISTVTQKNFQTEGKDALWT